MGTSKPLSMGSIGPREGGQKKNPGGASQEVSQEVPGTPPSHWVGHPRAYKCVEGWIPPPQMCRKLDITVRNVSKVGYHRQKCVENWISPPQMCRKLDITTTNVSKVRYHSHKCDESWISNFQHICGGDIQLSTHVAVISKCRHMCGGDIQVSTHVWR